MSNASQIHWVLDKFVSETPGVIHAQTMSSDGMPLAASSGISVTQAETFAAVTSGLASLCQSAGETFEMLPVVRTVIETAHGWIITTRVSARASLAIVATPDSDLGLVGYEMTILAEQTGEILSPELIDALKNTLAI